MIAICRQILIAICRQMAMENYVLMIFDLRLSIVLKFSIAALAVLILSFNKKSKSLYLSSMARKVTDTKSGLMVFLRMCPY